MRFKQFTFAVITMAAALVLPSIAQADHPERIAQAASASALAAVATTCRSASSSISGASITGTLCWGPAPSRGHVVARVSGKVTDNAGDGKYAMFRIHYRYEDILGWKTKTEIIKTTKGHYAPVTLSASWESAQYGAIKDFWIQVCKQGSGRRICDSTWH